MIVVNEMVSIAYPMCCFCFVFLKKWAQQIMYMEIQRFIESLYQLIIIFWKQFKKEMEKQIQ